MRSIWAVATSLLTLSALPLALAFQSLGGYAPEIVVHLVLGIGMVLLVRAVFDFGLPRWLNVIGAVSAGAFAVVFLLQAASLLLPGNAALDDVAFGLLGNWGERLLVFGIDAWFVGLLLLGSHGKTRIIGWVIVSILTAYHVVSSVGASLAITVPSLGVFSFLPLFVYLLIEGAKRGGQAGLGRQWPDSGNGDAPGT